MDFKEAKQAYIDLCTELEKDYAGGDWSEDKHMPRKYRKRDV